MNSCGKSNPVILFVIGKLCLGGAERVLTLYANHWAQKGWDVRILTMKAGDPYYPIDPLVRIVPLSVQVATNTLVDAVTNNIRILRALRRAIKAEPTAVIIPFIETTSIRVAIASIGLKNPIIISEHNNPIQNKLKPIWECLRRLTYRRASYVLVLTSDVLPYYKRINRRTIVIPNPVVPPLNEENASVTDISERPRKTIVWLGRLSPQKGLERLIEAFSQISDDFPDWDIEMWGDGDSRSSLEELIQSFHLMGRIRLPGSTKEPERILRQAELFVLPSRYEGFPMVLCEAMAAGLPVISFDCPSGPRDIIRDGVDGVLVPNGDVKALAGAMSRLMGNDKERTRLASRAPEVLERFRLEKVIEMWEILIEKSLYGSVKTALRGSDKKTGHC